MIESAKYHWFINNDQRKQKTNVKSLDLKENPMYRKELGHISRFITILKWNWSFGRKSVVCLDIIVIIVCHHDIEHFFSQSIYWIYTFTISCSICLSVCLYLNIILVMRRQVLVPFSHFFQVSTYSELWEIVHWLEKYYTCII